MDTRKKTKKNATLDKWLARKGKGTPRPSISKMPDETPKPLSHGQERLWLLQQLYPENPFYNYAHAYHFKGKLNVEVLIQSFHEIAQRHDVLRTNFQKEETQIVQKVKPEISTTDFVEIIDLKSLDFSEQQIKINEYKDAAARQHFDLENDTLFSIKILVLGEEEYILLFSIHHIIGDRWSLRVINEELAHIYKKSTEDSPIDLKPLPIQYADYSYWQRNQKISPNDTEYWLKQLAGELPVLKLPTDFPYPTRPTFEGKNLSRIFSIELSQKLKKLCQDWDITSFALTLAAYKTLLFRYTGQTDLLVGTPFTNRDKLVLEKLVGFFNETLVLRSDLSDEPTFLELAKQVKQTTMDALAHKNMPFDALVKKLKPERIGTSNPLFQVMFLYNSEMPSTKFGNDLELEESMIDVGVAKFDLTLFVNEKGNQMEAIFEYAKDLFEEATIERMVGHLEKLLNSIVENPNQRISEFSLLTEREKSQILNDFQNIPVTHSNKEKVPTQIHHFFEKYAQETPNQTAVVFENNQLTYRELNEKANTVAAALRNEGIGRDMPVGLYTNRSVNMMVGLLGILKSGGAYVPLDPEYPEERIEFMLEDAGVTVVLSQEEIKGQLPKTDAKIISIETVIDKPSSIKQPTIKESTSKVGDNLAYIIYTSGSTGKPKGVPITHQNLIHSTTARFDFFEHQPSAFLLLSSFSFDSSVVGIFWSICSGGTLVLPPKRIEQNMQAMAGLISKHQISHTLMLPSLYTLLLEHADADQLESLNSVMVAGEACFPTLVWQHFQILPNAHLYNEYGPTEATVWCTAHKMTKEDAKGLVPIGKPIANTQNYILDRNQNLVPIGVAGELYVGGKGVAKGYLNRPELTATRFFQNPFSENPKDRLYKTGDLVRYRSNGMIDFLGRVDHQVKIRGHRIELDEIKSIILQYPNVQEAVIQVQKEGNHQKLNAFLTSKGDISDLKNWLKTKLPDYMIPARFVVLEEFPRLPNGKINLNALPQPTESIQPTENFEAPKTETEKILAQIWESILNINPIGIHDNFFGLGGDSILSIRVIAQAMKKEIKLAANHLFEYQTIAELANFLDKKAKNGNVKTADTGFSSVVGLSTGGSKKPLFCVHSGGAHVFFYHNLAKHLGNTQPVYALQPKGLDGANDFHRSIENMAEYYISEMKKVQPEGPYSLLGTCFSNAVVLEMTHQLKAEGEEVAMLTIVDSGPAHLSSAKIRGEKQTTKRLANMVQKGNWKGIQKKLKHRAIRIKQKLVAPLQNDQERHLQQTINSLNNLYKFYNWKPFDGKVHFIRSSEFAQRPDKEFHLRQWQKLAKKGVDVHVVEGHHLTLFDEPEVQGLANHLKEALKEIED
jgi:amino acid adenylation domain-containing protein